MSPHVLAATCGSYGPIDHQIITMTKLNAFFLIVFQKDISVHYNLDGILEVLAILLSSVTLTLY